MSESKPYVSCIKVKGIHLLPPMITDTRRLEIQKDKNQAIKLEKRLKLCRNLKKSLEDFRVLHSLEPSNCSENNKINDSGISPSRNPVPPKTKLSRDIIDITEYNNDGIRLININKDLVTSSRQRQSEYVGSHQLLLNSCSSDAYDTDSSLNRSTEVAVSSAQSSARDQLTNLSSGSSKKSLVQPIQPLLTSEPHKKSRSFRNSKSTKSLKSPTSPPGRLIRSNSYTLEAPSPILLAHLKKCNADNSQLNPTLSRTWTSLENNFVPLEDSEYSSINTVYNTDIPCKENSSEIYLNKLDNEETSLPKEVEQKSPTIEVVQTDISVQQILVNANSEEIKTVKSTFDLSDPECQLIQVLKKIPEDYSRQIIELLERQRSEHQIKVDNFEKKFSSPVKEHSTSKKDEKPIDNNSNLSELSNWSNYYTPSETMTQYGQSGKMNEIETSDEISPYQKYKNISHEKSDSTLLPEETKFEHVTNLKIAEKEWCNINNTNKQTFITDFDTSDDTNSRKEGKRLRSSRKLFFKNTHHTDNTRKKWAANLICAYVKGYLTRRLLKTFRVQSLIDTIRDALICALELHKAEHIDEADVELHRRLINQVSAACYAFHDIFFSISIPEQMAIISADRKRLIEKTRRPSSAPDIRRPMSNSSRSSTKSFHSQSHTLMKI